MRAVCLLLCLAFVHYSAAAIFPHQNIPGVPGHHIGHHGVNPQLEPIQFPPAPLPVHAQHALNKHRHHQEAEFAGELAAGNAAKDIAGLEAGKAAVGAGALAAGKAAIDAEGFAAGKAAVDAGKLVAGKTAIDAERWTAGKAAVDAGKLVAGKTAIDAERWTAGKAAVDAGKLVAGKTAIDAEGWTAGKAAVDAGKLVAGKTAIDAEGWTAGKAAVDAGKLVAGKTAIDAEGWIAGKAAVDAGKLVAGKTAKDKAELVANAAAIHRLGQKHRAHQNHKNHQSSEEYSDDMHSSSIRTKKNSDHEFAEPLNPDSTNMNSPLMEPSVNPDIDENSYGDAISSRGIRMAQGPNAVFANKKDIEKIYKNAYKNMQYLNEQEKQQFHQQYELSVQNNNEDVSLNATQLLLKNNYQAETHTVQTDDGYALTMFRILPKQKSGKVVLMMHGFLGSADDWLLMGPGKSLAYLLADNGYIVYLGNARGNKYSRRHASKHPAQPDFWYFSNDEIALHDLPAMIDYALNDSQQSKLYYVGYDQGSAVGFALTAAQPEYNNKIAMMYALSPMVFMAHVQSPLFRLMDTLFYDRYQEYFGIGEFNPSEEVINAIGGAMCQNQIGCDEVCSNLNFAMFGANMKNIEPALIPVIMGHLPAGASVKQLEHYAQAVYSNDFRMYDYGSEINKQIYGTVQPQRYNLENVTMPVALYYSHGDMLSDLKDVNKLQKKLKNVQEAYQVPEQYFAHMDYQFSFKAPELIYKKIVESMKQQQQ